ncbi:MAG: succinylglutamate desuccinylase/aspartoacylase family protein [Pseudomonadota bacterium]
MLKKTHIAVAQNASGRNLHVPVYTLGCGKPGPKVYIQSSIHGAEVQGNVVIHHIIQHLADREIFGSITLVPSCNPVGTNIKAGEYTLGRFDPVNGTNWNRGYFFDESAVLQFADEVKETDDIIKIKQDFQRHWQALIQDKINTDWGIPLAQRLNLTLQLVALDADIVMDLHNGPVSSRHIYVPEYAECEIGHFSVSHNILIPNRFAGALDEATFCPWWTLSQCLEAKFSRCYAFEKYAYTIEMGSQEVIDFAEGDTDAQNILAYLGEKEVLFDCEFTALNMTRYVTDLADYKTLYSDFGGMVEYVAKPGQLTKRGETMARMLNIDELDNANAVKEIAAPCDLIPILHFPSASVLSGTQLYKCFTNFRVF